MAPLLSSQLYRTVWSLRNHSRFQHSVLLLVPLTRTTLVINILFSAFLSAVFLNLLVLLEAASREQLLFPHLGKYWLFFSNFPSHYSLCTPGFSDDKYIFTSFSLSVKTEVADGQVCPTYCTIAQTSVWSTFSCDVNLNISDCLIFTHHLSISPSVLQPFPPLLRSK